MEISLFTYHVAFRYERETGEDEKGEVWNQLL